MSKVILKVLGTAQDGGVPHPNCFCENCSRSIENPSHKRLAASLAVVLPKEKKWHLIDATPDIKEQLIRVQTQYQLESIVMENVFLTHAHVGHLPGLLFFGKETMNTKQLSVMAGAKMKHLIETNAPWSLLTDLNNIVLKEMEHLQKVELSHQVVVQPIEVPHRNEFTETFGFRIFGPNKKVLYIPDIDHWEDWDVNIYEECIKADICIIDGTFYSSKELEHINRDIKKIPHPLITDTMKELQDIANETDVYFTHLNHSNPALNRESTARKTIEEKGFHILEENLELII